MIFYDDFGKALSAARTGAYDKSPNMNDAITKKDIENLKKRLDIGDTIPISDTFFCLSPAAQGRQEKAPIKDIYATVIGKYPHMFLVEHGGIRRGIPYAGYIVDRKTRGTWRDEDGIVGEE